MSATQHSDPSIHTPSGEPPQRFRAPTVEEALRRARELLGDDAEIIEANRIRRGGIGGFFATELGVEVLAQGGSEAAARPPSAAPRRGDEHIVRPPMTAMVPAAEPPGPANDLTAAPARGRAAWRAATSTGAGPLGEEQLTMPLLATLAERATADERRSAPVRDADRGPRRFRPWKVTPPADADDASTPPPASAAGATRAHDATVDDAGEAQETFADHFLRELMADAEALRKRPGRSKVLPTARPGVTPLPGLEEPEGAVGPPAAARSTSGTRRRTPSRARRSSSPHRDVEPQLPLAEPTPAGDTGDTGDAPVTAGPAGSGPGTDATLAALVDHCVQLAAMSDRGGTPAKVALAMTMADGGVMKVTVELPRSR